MGLVFLMILALWGIMALLVLLTTRTTPSKIETTGQTSEMPAEAHHKAEAAAAAVAFALAQEQSRRQLELKAGMVPTSQWLLTGRLQQINQGIRGRRG
jgi:Na+-transporting methylmalonyl-CoA/oxaloacetate decarboxylase gamma subunit